MSLDQTTIISSLIGSLIAMATGIVVALLYIRNQNSSEKRRRLHEQIQETYIEQGILPIQEALSQYGIGTTLGINDVKIWSVRVFRFGEDEEILKHKVDEIIERPIIKDLLGRQFSYAIESFSYLRRFGMPLYSSIVRTLQHYSILMSDVTNYKNLRENIDGSGIDEFERSTTVVGQIIQMTQIFLQTRLDNLKDYIWQKDCENYADFLKMLKEDEYQKFLSDFDQYFKLLTDFMDSLRSPNGSKSRKDSSLALSDWLHDNTDKNPFTESRAHKVFKSTTFSNTEMSYEDKVAEFKKLYQEITKERPTIIGETFQNQTINIDFKKYQNCLFKDCIIEIEFGICSFKDTDVLNNEFRMKPGSPADFVRNVYSRIEKRPKSK